MKPQPDLALTIIRVVVGGVFCWQGWQTLFVTGLAAFTARLSALDVPLPLLVSPVTAVLELLGGLLLILGVGARGLAGALASVTLLIGGASVLHGLSPVRVELALLLVAGSLAVLVGGSGSFSVEHLSSGAPSRLAPPPPRAVRRKKG